MTVSGPEPNERRTIELDCPPGWPRPGDLIGEVIEGIGLPEIETASRFFGNWTWDYTALISAEEWERVRPVLQERIKRLYDSWAIRYGSW
jgi:hypothetical protein